MPTDQPDIVVFLGPTLPAPEAAALLPAAYFPPVQQGSVYEAARSRPRAIAIIDGYFGWVPSVWHKEILWALDQGIAVYGASSMGALRAAELHQFGMAGHGAVFRDYLEGRLHDDDEVAIVHADGQERFRPLSAAMVNIRYTLADAETLGLISSTSSEALIRYFKGRFFADRRLQGLRAQLRPLSLIPEEELERLAGWLPGNYRDIKQEDAVGLLRRLAEEPALTAVAEPPRFCFQPTVNWLQLTEAVDRKRQSVATVAEGGDPGASVAPDEVMAECRLEGSWPAVEAMALVRLVAGNPQGPRHTVTEEEYLSELARRCVCLGLEDLTSVASWLQAVGWESARFAQVVEREALLKRAREYWTNDLQEAARDVLILEGRYQRLADRARRKRGWLDANGGAEEILTHDTADALAWFRDRMDESHDVPDELLARRHGWPSVSDMRDEVVSEHAFSTRGG